MGVAFQEGYRVRREEGEDSALAKAKTHGGQERLLERHLEKSKQRGRRKWERVKSWKPGEEREGRGWVTHGFDI